LKVDEFRRVGLGMARALPEVLLALRLRAILQKTS
jgi:hypothetical protein